MQSNYIIAIYLRDITYKQNASQVANLKSQHRHWIRKTSHDKILLAAELHKFGLFICDTLEKGILVISRKMRHFDLHELLKYVRYAILKNDFFW